MDEIEKIKEENKAILEKLEDCNKPKPDDGDDPEEEPASDPEEPTEPV